MTDGYQLVNNGYAILRTSHAVYSDGTSSDTFSVRGYQHRVRPDGSFNYDPPDVVTVAFEYMDPRGDDRLTPVAKKFADALVATLAGIEPKRMFRKQRPVDESTPRPLVRVTDTSVWIVYRKDKGFFDTLRLGPPTFAHARDLFAHGLRARDQGRYDSALALQADTRDIPIDDGAEWIDGRSPLTVPHSALPEWQGEQTSLALHNVVEQWVAAGDVRECDAYKEPPLEGGYSPEAMLARQGVTIGHPTDEWTGEGPRELWRERGRWG
jgi:hypothetical protein